MSDNLWDRIGSGATGSRASIADAIETVFETVSQMARFLVDRGDRYRSRQQLRDLSDEHLRDIGLTRRQADAEAGRPFFDN